MARTVLITGCSSGIGRATARAFLDDGWQVYATARDVDDVDGLGDRGARTAALDVTSTDDVRRVVERTVAETGRLDCLVNNAGYGQVGPIEDVPVEDVVDQYDVNVFGVHRTLRAAVPALRRQGGGTVINVASTEDRFPFPGSGVYSGSKAALATLSQALRQEVARFDVDVVVIEPSFVATPFYDRMRAELADVDRSPGYDDLYALLEEMGAVQGGGPGIALPSAVAETIVEAADSDDPAARYAVGGPAKAGSILAAVVPSPWRPAATRLLVRAATTRPVQWLLREWNERYRRGRRRSGE